MERPSTWKVLLQALLQLQAAALLVHCARLPYTGVRPLAYKLLIRPDFQRDCAFSAEVDITLDVENSTNEIALFSRHLRIDESNILLTRLNENQLSDSAEDEDSEQNITLSYGASEAKHILRISLSDTLEQGSQYNLRLAYNGTMSGSGKSNGIYCRKYRQNNDTRWFMSTTFQPYMARSAFPSFDEPALKAKFSIKLVHSKEYTALSNMPAVSVKPMEGEEGLSVTEFETTPLMSTYLVSFFLGQFHSREVKVPDGHVLRVWASSEENLEKADLSLIFAKRHYQYLLNYTGLQDPIPKTDLMAIRHYPAGGLENWGIISLEERLVLLDSRARSKKANLLRASSLIAHELTHTWFGNLVTPAYWDDIWLSEGFSSYFAAKATNDMYPNYGYDVQAWVLSRLAAMGADSLSTAHPLKVKVEEHPTGDLFDEITYHKGDLMVRMLEQLFGEEALQKAIQKYLQERKFNTASDTRLWELLEAEAEPGILPENVTLTQIMKTWTELPGYPIVTVRRNYNTSEVTFSQRNILETEGEAGGWWIPITYTCTEERDFKARPKFWLSPYSGPVTKNISLPRDHWLMVNTRGAGYYAVHYDTRNSLLLADDLESLPDLERVQVFGDILELGRLGQTPVELSLDVLVHFSVETAPATWFLFLASVPKYMNLFKATPLESQFKKMVQGILDPEMQKLTNDSPHRKQVIKLSCKVGVKNCTDMAMGLFQEWKENNTKLSEDVQYTVFCTAVASGDKSTWDYLMERYKSSESHKEKKDLLKALACTTDKELKKRYLSWALEKKDKETVRKDSEMENGNGKCGKNSAAVLRALAEEDPDMVLSTLSKQIKKDRPTKRSRDSKWRKVLEHVALHVNNEQQLKQLKQIMEEQKSKLKAAEDREGKCRILEIAENSVSWLKENEKKAESWFKNYSVSQSA